MRRSLGMFLVILIMLGIALPVNAACTAGHHFPKKLEEGYGGGVEESIPSADFTDNGNGTVIHNKTKLTWMRCGLGQSWDGKDCLGVAATYSWVEALRAVQGVNTLTVGDDNDGRKGFSGKTDWRLPNVNELQSIVEYCGTGPSINQTIFPRTLSRPQSGHEPLISEYWSATTYVANAAFAWFVGFYSGDVDVNNKGSGFYVRLVRGGN